MRNCWNATIPLFRRLNFSNFSTWIENGSILTDKRLVINIQQFDQLQTWNFWTKEIVNWICHPSSVPFLTIANDWYKRRTLLRPWIPGSSANYDATIPRQNVAILPLFGRRRGIVRNLKWNSPLPAAFTGLNFGVQLDWDTISRVDTQLDRSACTGCTNAAVSGMPTHRQSGRSYENRTCFKFQSKIVKLFPDAYRLFALCLFQEGPSWGLLLVVGFRSKK
jgi:hypothetical protein